MTPDTLKTWRARLGLGEAGMAAYLGVPVTTYRKWENGTRIPDAAPQRLLALLQRIETDAPVIHADLIAQARASAPEPPAGAPKRRGKGKGAATPEKPASGPFDASIPWDFTPITWADDGQMPDWMTAGAPA